VIVEAQARAAAILAKHKVDLVAVRDELLSKKTIEGERVREIIDGLRKRYPSDVGAPGPEIKLAAGAGTTTAEGNGVAKAPAPSEKDKSVAK
jgi:cell division protease FtsH